MIVKEHPRDDKARALRVSHPLLDATPGHLAELGTPRDGLLFPSTGTRGGNPISPNMFRTKAWLPALDRAGLNFHVRVHDLRHAHASWLLAGGADLKAVMERMGHSQIMTTQRYLHSLPDAQDKALAAFEMVRNRTTRT